MDVLVYFDQFMLIVLQSKVVHDTQNPFHLSKRDSTVVTLWLELFLRLQPIAKFSSDTYRQFREGVKFVVVDEEFEVFGKECGLSYDFGSAVIKSCFSC